MYSIVPINESEIKLQTVFTDISVYVLADAPVKSPRKICVYHELILFVLSKHPKNMLFSYKGERNADWQNRLCSFLTSYKIRSWNRICLSS